MQDDVYRGMFIPKGSLVFANIRHATFRTFGWGLMLNFTRGMSLDETVYSDPTSFSPERFLPKPAGNGEPYFNSVAFGFGRRFEYYISPPISSDTIWESTRICTGQYVAENSLWIAIASILASCKISNAVDENGNIIVPDATLTDGIVRQVQHVAV
jgi:cytochrome P450